MGGGGGPTTAELSALPAPAAPLDGGGPGAQHRSSLAGRQRRRRPRAIVRINRRTAESGAGKLGRPAAAGRRTEPETPRGRREREEGAAAANKPATHGGTGPTAAPPAISPGRRRRRRRATGTVAGGGAYRPLETRTGRRRRQ